MADDGTDRITTDTARSELGVVDAEVFVAVGADVLHLFECVFGVLEMWHPTLPATFSSSSEVLTSSSMYLSHFFSGLATSLAFLAASLIFLGFLGELDQLFGALHDILLGLCERWPCCARPSG